MPVQIGASTHSFSDPTGLLSDCHRRVEMFLGALQAVAVTAHQKLTGEARRSLDLGLRYFREAAPKHTADEEESLFPRLRAMNDPELDAVIKTAEALEVDHRWAEPLHNEVDAIGTRYLESGELSAADTARFREAVEQLAEMYRRHIQLEDTQVFPIAARKLSAEQKTKIAEEMAKRRSVKVTTL